MTSFSLLWFFNHPVLENLYSVLPYHVFLQPNAFACFHPVSFIHAFSERWIKWVTMEKSPVLLHFSLQPLRSDTSKMFMTQIHFNNVRKTRQLYGAILVPNDANPLCDFI